MTTDFKLPKDLIAADSEKLASEAVKQLLWRKAAEVKLYDVRETTSITDFYINVTATSLTHVASLSEDLSDNFEDRGMRPYRIEGKRGCAWILVDFGSIIVNIFDAPSRRFYDFDRLLPAECEKDISDLLAEVDKMYE